MDGSLSSVTLRARAATWRRRALVWLPVVGLVAVVLASPGSSVTRQGGALAVSPKVYVGGQQLRFEGDLGQSGRTRIRLQYNMNRPGDRWTDIDGFRTTTAADGTFSFGYPAPSMDGISLRVAGGGAATPGWTFHARSQEVVLSLLPTAANLGDGRVARGGLLNLLVDTTPTLPGRSDLPPPVFPGRGLALQQRLADGTWETLASGTTDDQGHASFDLALPSLGTTALRVRMEDWTRNGDEVGWFPSFPLELSVLPVGPVAGSRR